MRVDVRVIAATNSDLAGNWSGTATFREDLYYRLNVIPIHLPPLRERREDVPLLIQGFLEKIGRGLAPPRADVAFSQDAMRRMMAFDWPGNIRQLENVVERALALTPGRARIDAGDLPPEIRESGGGKPEDADAALPEDGIDLPGRLGEIERGLIARALERTGGNRHQAARLLNVKRTTLVEKIRRLGL